jgi:hypothetical protein
MLYIHRAVFQLYSGWKQVIIASLCSPLGTGEGSQRSNPRSCSARLWVVDRGSTLDGGRQVAIQKEILTLDHYVNYKEVREEMS